MYKNNLYSTPRENMKKQLSKNVILKSKIELKIKVILNTSDSNSSKELFHNVYQTFHFYNLNLEQQSRMSSLVSHTDSHLLHLNNQLNELSSEELKEMTIQNETYLLEFKKNIEISRHTLIDIVQNDSFITFSEDLNRKAVDLLRDGFIDQASIYLAEAQKVLEYAANRGKQINRNLIVTVLHNEAYCHQQSWKLERCANYIEALIYNLNCQLKLIETESSKGLIVSQGVQIRSSLAHYYLLFCAINSQLKHNDAALIAAKQASKLLKDNSIVLHRLALLSKANTDSGVIVMLEELSKLQSSGENVQISKLIQAVRYFRALWKNKCMFPNFQFKQLIEKLKEFSIGNIMQMEPLPFSNNSPSFNLSLEKLYMRIIMISMSYFTMATQLRLLALRLGGSKESAQKSSQYRQSQCYHLFAIILIFYYIPFDLLYLQHILVSFKTHYLINIEQLEPIVENQSNPQKVFQILLKSQQKEDEKSSTEGFSDKQQSEPRNSFEIRKSNLSKLQSYVRASLRGQQYQKGGDLAKLNNYYYMRGQEGQSKDRQQNSHDKISNRISQKSKKKGNSKRGCITSKHSVQKTPIGYTPNDMSPKHSKCSYRSSKGNSLKRNPGLKTEKSSKKLIIANQYFHFQKENQQKQVKLKSKSKKKVDQIRQHNEYTTFTKLKKGPSQQNSTWRGSNLTNKIHFPFKKLTKESSELKNVKSLSKLKGKLVEARSKKKQIVS